MPAIFRTLIWIAVSVPGAGAVAFSAFQTGETINALWLVIAGVLLLCGGVSLLQQVADGQGAHAGRRPCSAVGDASDGKDYVPTNRWVVFGHHFAAIAGPGPLVGPVLAAQFGYLPGMLWILIGATLGGGCA